MHMFDCAILVYSATAARRRTSGKDENHFLKTEGERTAEIKACNTKEKTRLQLASLLLVTVLIALAFFLSKVF